MRESEERYISLLTDFGFKRIFGTEPNQDLLVNFLNSLFDGEQVVKSVTFLNSENVGDVYTDRKAIFDVYCENERGEKFIVEMQNAYQTFFKDRSLYHSTFPIREQAPKGADWNFRLTAVYVVALLNFNMNDEAFDKDEIIHNVGLLDKTTYKEFNRNLNFKYVEVAKFDKSLDELTSLQDKWLFLLKNLSRLDKQPKELKEKVFEKLFTEAKMAKFTRAELKEYEDSLKAYRDIKNSIDSAEEKGRTEGREEGIAQGRAEGIKEGLVKGITEGKRETARNLLALGVPTETIAKATGLTEEEIKSIHC